MFLVTDGRVTRGLATRDGLITAAVGLFGSRGYEATSITDVLEAAGVAKGALYHHFETKTALFDAVLDRVVGEAAINASERASRSRTPLSRLKAGCAAWLELSLDPAFQQIAFIDAPAVVGWTRIREIDDEHTLGGIRRSLRDLEAASRKREADVDLLAHMILAAVNEAALFIVRAEDPAAALAIGRRTVDTLLDRLET